MHLSETIYDWLSKSADSDCDDILGAALPHAETPWAERIVQILLEHDRAASWRALLGQFNRFQATLEPLLDFEREPVRAGLAGALQAADARERENAFKVLRRYPTPNLAYAVANALRDPVPANRESAAEILRQMADEALKPFDAPSSTKEPHVQPFEPPRSIVLALREGLKAYDQHVRAEILEAAVWYARWMGEDFWEKITAVRSHAGVSIRHHLDMWDCPRIAHFSVKALKYRELREVAARVLRNWHTPDQITALLAENELLEDVEISQALRNVQQPTWFQDLDRSLRRLPAECRPHAPRWIGLAGYREADRIELLSRWIRAQDPELHAAAVYELARLDTPGARRLLEQVSRGDSRLAGFAHWSVRAFELGAVRRSVGAVKPEHDRAEPAAERGPAELSDNDADCIMLWLACRRAPQHAREELIRVLRSNARAWHPWLRLYLRSPDPRDRVLALQVINTDALVGGFSDEIAKLSQDSIEGIRRFASTLQENLRRQSMERERKPTPRSAQEKDIRSSAAHAARRELRRTLELISTGEMAEEDAALAQRVRQLLDEVYPAHDTFAEIGAGAR